MVTVGKRVTVGCLDCELPIELSYKPVEGQIITCPHCDVELEVINTEPLEIDFYFEDWNDDEEWDEAYEEEEDDDEDWDDED
jgi:peptide subunit release factor 1 (eRF1)